MTECGQQGVSMTQSAHCLQDIVWLFNLEDPHAESRYRLNGQN